MATHDGTARSLARRRRVSRDQSSGQFGGSGDNRGRGAKPISVSVSDNPAAKRFEVTVNGQTAFLAYERTPDTLTLVHTEVPEPLRGRHLGDDLVAFALHFGRAAGLRIVAVCPFVRAYMRKHPPIP